MDFNSSGRWHLLEKKKKVPVSQNKLFASSTCQDKKTQKTKKLLLHLLLRVKQRKSRAQFLGEDKPHVQSIEEKDAVAWFQSTFLGRTI